MIGVYIQNLEWESDVWKLAEDTISNEDVDMLADWLKTYPRLTQGSEVKAFESEWSKWLGVKHSIMVSSGTTANFALIAVVSDLLNKKGKDLRVGVSSITWATNWTPSMLLGNTLVVFDVDKSNLGASKEQLKKAIVDNEIDVYFATHLLGFNCLDQEIIDLAKKHNVFILEDCCESHGAKCDSKKIGSIGYGSSFSFYFGHHMSTIEGGMISTNNDDFADKLKMFRSHGLARESKYFDSYKKQNEAIDSSFLFITAGLNFRSTDLNAFIGRSQLRSLDQRIKQRNRNLKHFLNNAPNYIWKEYNLEGVSSFSLPLICNDEKSFKKVKNAVLSLGLEYRPIAGGNLLVQPFLEKYKDQIVQKETINADTIQKFGVYVGNGHHVTKDMIDKLLKELGK